MSIEIVEQNFGRWITPDQQAGITPPENLYDANGTPLPYIQDQGGPRTFRSTDGQAYAPTAPIQGTSSPTPAPLAPATQGPIVAQPSNRVQIPMMLRGEPGGPSQATAGLDVPSYAYPDDGPGPQNLLPPGRSNGQGAVLPIPPAPTNRLAVPSEAQERVTLQSNSQRTIEDTVARQAISDRALGSARNPRGNSTTPTPQTQGPAPSRNNNAHPMDTTFQQVIRRPGATVRDMLEAGGFNFDWFGNRTQAQQPEVPTTDVRTERPNVQRTSSTAQWNGQITEVSPDQQAGRAEEVAAMLRARGIRVTSVTRQGNARSHGHPAGNSIDVDPNDQRAAQDLIHTYYPGLAVELIPVEAGQDFGNGVRSTGRHGHIDLGPVAGPRRRR